MRLRNIPGANEAVAASPYCIQNAAEHRGQWHAFFEKIFKNLVKLLTKSIVLYKT